jgi:hypothetical protein
MKRRDLMLAVPALAALPSVQAATAPLLAPPR